MFNRTLIISRADDQFAHLLAPAAALSPSGSSAAPTYDTLSDTELETLIAELEPDIRAADRDLREIDELESRGVTAAGKLPGLSKPTSH